MRAQKPEELFDANGKLMPELKELAPTGNRRMSANPHANGGLLKKALRLPDFRDYALKVDKPGTDRSRKHAAARRLPARRHEAEHGHFRSSARTRTPPTSSTTSTRSARNSGSPNTFPEDADGGELATDGRVIEMLSEHTMEGMLEGYLLTGRHGFFSYLRSLRACDRLDVQPAREVAVDLQPASWREEIASLNLLITSTVWRQDHNGFTHQDPGFLDVVVNKSADVTRIYLPPDVNSLLSVADHCLRSENYINVIVCDKQMHLQYWTWTPRSGTAPKASASGIGPATTRAASRTS